MTEYKRPIPLWERLSKINQYALQGDDKIVLFKKKPLYIDYLNAQSLNDDERLMIDESINSVRKYLKGKKLPETTSGIRTVLLKNVDDLQEVAGINTDQISTLLTMFVDKQKMVSYRLSLRNR